MANFPSRARPTLQWVTSVQRVIKATISTSSVTHCRLAWSSSARSGALYLQLQHLGQLLSISLTLQIPGNTIRYPIRFTTSHWSKSDKVKSRRMNPFCRTSFVKPNFPPSFSFTHYINTLRVKTIGHEAGANHRPQFLSPTPALIFYLPSS